MKTEHCYVHKDRAICGGDPVIVGTRIPVRLVYQRTQAGEPMETIRQAFPHLTPAQIHNALSYAYDHLAEIEQEPSVKHRHISQKRRTHPADLPPRRKHPCRPRAAVAPARH